MAGQARGTAGRLSAEELPAWQLARRQRIVQAAVQALEAEEYERIQMRDVAASAGVALGTLYRYFSSKEHLYAAVLREWAPFERARNGRTSTLEPEVRIRRRVHAVIRAFQRRPRFSKVQVRLQASADPNARELLDGFHRQARESLAGEFDMLPAEDADDAAIMLWSIINSMLTRAVYRGLPMAEVHRVVDRFLDLLAPRLA